MDKVDIGSYSYTTEYEGKIAESPELKIFDGVRLFPLRYGLFRNKERTKETVYPVERLDYVLDGLNNYYAEGEPFGYYMNPMILHNGFLYVYSHTTKSVYIYRCTNNNFQLEEIRKTKNSTGASDCMEQCIGHTYQYIPLLSNDNVHIYYSSIELSDDFIKAKYDEEPVIGEPFNCKDWIEGTTPSNPRQRVMDADGVWFMFDSLLLDDAAVSDSINKQYKTTIDTVKLQNSEQKVCYRDVFFLLDDPLGFAAKLQYDLNDARINHEALLRSIRSGVSPGEIKKLLLLKSSNSKSPIADMDLFTAYPQNRIEQIAQAQQIHTLALYLYNFVFVQKTHLSSGKSVLKEDFFKKLFATDERRRNHKVIEDIRLLINQFLLSPVFKNHCKLFTLETKDIATSKEDERHAQMKAEMQKAVSSLILSWVPVPHINDKGIDGERTYKGYIDKCEGTIREMFKSFIEEGSCEVGKFFKDIPTLAGLSMDIAKDKESSSADTVVSSIFLLMDNLTNSWWRFAFEAQKTTLFIANFRVDPQHLLIEFKKGDVTQFLNQQGRTLYDSEVINGRGVIQIRVEKVSDLNKPVRVDTIAKNPTKYQKLFKRLEVNNSYLSILSFMQLAAIIEGYDKNQTIKETVVNSIEFASAVATIQRRFVEAGLELRQASSTGQVSNTIKSLGIVRTQMAVLGAVGMFAGAADAAINAFALISRNDKDAAAFYFIATGALITGGITSLLALKFAWAGPIGLYCAIAAFIALFVAEMLKYSTIQAFIKQTVLWEDFIDKYVPNYNNSEAYEIIDMLSSREMRSKFLNSDILDEADNKHKVMLVEYRYQVEEFLYTQAMLPFFRTTIQYISEPKIYAPGTRIEPYDIIKLEISSNISQIAMNLSHIELTTAYVVKNKLIKNETKKISFEIVNKGHTDNTMTIATQGGATIFENSFLYTLYDRQPDRKLHYREADALYLLVFICFIHNDNSITPMPRMGKKSYLIYRYKINIPEQIGNSKVFDYHAAKAEFQEAIISPFNDSVWNF